MTVNDESVTKSPKRPADCMACRITGSLTFAAVSAWLLYERGQLPKVPSSSTHRNVLLFMSVGFIGASIYRISFWRNIYILSVRVTRWEKKTKMVTGAEVQINKVAKMQVYRTPSPWSLNRLHHFSCAASGYFQKLSMLSSTSQSYRQSQIHSLPSWLDLR